MESSKIVVRQMEADDTAFVLSTWLTNFKFSSDFTKDVPQELYFKNQRPIAEKILSDFATAKYVAVLSDEPQVILGYLIVGLKDDVPVLHYGYVKSAFRRMGIFWKLLKAAGLFDAETVYVSHLTYDGKKLIDKYGWHYCPYLA